ncbi:hypothetical protein AB0F81_36355 [Actinoplanes sp. NPDC024001]|uniref:hypothetical protein n=1 Tax=Actinoplanes sp. NPDC024001 TaxID=3154598 RepID=UPI0034010E00
MSISPPEPGRAPVRRHLIALPRERPGTVRRHLVALPRGRPTVRFDLDDSPQRRDRRPLLAVIVSFALLLLLCGGALAGLSRVRDHGGDVRPATSVPAQPSVTAVAQEDARTGRRCGPTATVGRTSQGLLMICGPDRRGRDRWRPMSPTTWHHLSGRSS